MSQQIINVGTAPNDGTGDPIRTSFTKTNTNFTQLFALPNPTPPTTLVGKAGDVPGMYAYSSNYFYYCFGTYDGTSTIWAQVDSAANISGTAISSGNSSVSIDGVDGNILVSVDGTPNVAAFLSNGISLQGNTVSNNIFANAYYYANGVLANYGNANVADYLPTYTGNISAAYYSGDGSQLTGVVATNLGNSVSVTGNVTASYFIGNGALLTGINSFSGNNISITGNIQANNIVGNGFASFASGVYAAGNGITSAGNISASGNIYGHYIFGTITANTIYSNTVTNNAQPNITSVGNLTSLVVVGNASAGNVLAGGYFFANGAPFTTYDNSNVAAYMPSYVGNLNNIQNITATGNVAISANVTAGGTLLVSGAAGLLSNLAVGNNLTVNSTLSVAGNTTITSNVNIGNNISTLGNVRAQGYMSAAGNIYSAGYFVGNFTGNVSGNLTVPGSNTQVLYNASGSAGASAGLTYTSNPNTLGVLGNASLQGNIFAATMSASGDILAVGNLNAQGDVSAIGNVITDGRISALGNVYTSEYFIGNFLGNITGNLSVPGSTSQVLFNASGNAGASAGFTYTSSPNLVTVLGSITATGRVTGATLSGALTTNAQPNITSVGTLSTLSVTGSVTAGQLYGNGVNITNVNGANVSNTVPLATTALYAGTVTTAAQPNITSTGTLTSLSVNGNTVVSSGFFKLPSYTSVQIDALSGMTGGELVYNTTLNVIQGYMMNPATSTMGWVSWTVAVYQ